MSVWRCSAKRRWRKGSCCLAHRSCSSDRSLREGKWEKKKFTGTELSGKNLGLIGFGRIAQGVANVAKLLGMEIHTYDPYLPPKVARQQGAFLHKKVDTLFKTCTHVSIHCNLTEETHHLVKHSKIIHRVQCPLVNHHQLALDLVIQHLQQTHLHHHQLLHQ